MKKKPRGVCIIINNTFETEEFKERMGTHADKNRLKRLFEWLHFRVYVKTDLKKQEIEELFQGLGKEYQISENPEENSEYHNLLHSESDCFVFCILSHGFTYGLFGTDGNFLETAEIIKYLAADYCPGLAGKPKIGFIQACRGEKDVPLTFRDFIPTKNLDPMRIQQTNEDQQNPVRGKGKRSALTDIFLYNATAEGERILVVYLFVILFRMPETKVRENFWRT